MGDVPLTKAKHFQAASRGRGDITAIVIHTLEYPERPTAAEWAAGFFRDPHGPKGPVAVSAHYTVDADSITHSVLEKDIAWHAGPANGWSVGIEHAGYASQSAAEWSDTYSTSMLERSAELAAGICRRYGIPAVRLTAEDLKAGKRLGICGHLDVTNGLTGGKGHVDPGPNFPWAWYLERVAALVESTPTTPAEEPRGGTTKALVQLEDELFAHANFATWVEVSGVLVCPFYVAPVGIGEAADLAKRLGCELPTPALVDAIWLAADLKIDPSKVVAAASGHDGTAATMDSAETHAKVASVVETEVHRRGPYRLLAGAFKDVVVRDGNLGLYGWHRPDGTAIQSFFGGHALAWRDYSQGLRLVRRM